MTKRRIARTKNKVRAPVKMKRSKTVAKRIILTAGGMKTGATCRQHNAMSSSNTTMGKSRTRFLHPTRIKQIRHALGGL
jgi:ribosomal protein L35